MKHLFIALVLMSLASCQLERELNPAVDPADLYGSVEQPADLPVPRELDLLIGVNQSRYLAKGSFRSAKLLYNGKIGLQDVRKFLRDRLPDHGWTLRTEDTPARDRAIQHWVRDREDGVRYLLLAEIDNEGGVSRLSYDLRTTRIQTAANANATKDAAKK